MACTLNGTGHTALKFQRSTCDTAGQYLTLLVEEFFKELRVLVVYVFNTCAFEAAVFLLLGVY